MKTLLYKQFRLVCHPMTLIFCLFGIMVLIPNYPYTVIFFYVMLGLFFTFLNIREQKDIYYSALLPVPKRDTVKAGCAFVVIIEVLSLVVLIPCSLLERTIWWGSTPIWRCWRRGFCCTRCSTVCSCRHSTPTATRWAWLL